SPALGRAGLSSLALAALASARSPGRGAFDLVGVGPRLRGGPGVRLVGVRRGAGHSPLAAPRLSVLLAARLLDLCFRHARRSRSSEAQPVEARPSKARPRARAVEHRTGARSSRLHRIQSGPAWLPRA